MLFRELEERHVFCLIILVEQIGELNESKGYTFFSWRK